MSEILLNYFNKHKNQGSFYINNIAEELKIPASALASLLEQFSNDYPSMGIYNRKTGYFNRLEKEPATLTVKMLKTLFIFLLAIVLLVFSPQTIFPFTMLISFYLIALSGKEFMLYVLTFKSIYSQG